MSLNEIQQKKHPAQSAFTLIELLVVIAIIAILAGMVLPALSRAREQAVALRVRGDLNQISMALLMYSDDHEGAVPPVRINCNTDMSTHWCELPTELSEGAYLPRSDKPGMAAHMEDLFNRGHTYKYATPGPCLLNESPGTDYQVWVPDDFPVSQSQTGKYYDSLENSPVKWVVWSMGPRPSSSESQHAKAPLTSESWYKRTGGGGILMQGLQKNGQWIKSP